MSPPRLSAVDASFLYLEQPRTPMHVGAVGIFRAPAGGFDYERLVETVERRLVAVPRYRQKVRHVPGELARPVWVDDADFDDAFDGWTAYGSAGCSASTRSASVASSAHSAARLRGSGEPSGAT